MQSQWNELVCKANAYILKAELLVIGKTDEAYLNEGITNYLSRLGNTLPFEIVILPDLKQRRAMNFEQQKQQEGEKILSVLSTSDYLVLLDENGKQYTSRQFAGRLQKFMNSGMKKLVFVIGGPYGFSQDVYARANEKMSLSAMTFSHQMVRLIFIEQLYRAVSILNNSPYHHD